MWHSSICVLIHNVWSANNDILKRLLTTIVSIAILVSALTVKGKSTILDRIILSIICLSLIYYALLPYLNEYIYRRISLSLIIFYLKKPTRWMISPKGSLIAMIIVIIFIGIVAESIPEDNVSSRLSRAQSWLGLVVFILFLWATSNNRTAIEWRTVWVGILLQFLLALFVLQTWVGYQLFKFLSDIISSYLSFSEAGYAFLFNRTPSNFAESVFPAIIFFCATVECLYYFGILQVIIRKFGVFFLHLMGTSGAESVVAAASPFVGQGENALLVRPFVNDLTKSEIHQIMTSGFATISGSVLFGYISLGISAQSLITAAVMSVPCSIALSKLRYPETEVPATKGEVKEISQNETHHANNALQALGNGAKMGMKIVLIIAASLISVLSLLSAVDAVLTWFGNFYNIPELTIQKILSYPLYPVTWLMGVAWSDVAVASELLALKIAANEFVAFSAFVTVRDTLAPRTQIIVTYALCGFANFSSIGIQLGILGSIAPTRLQDFASLALSAMLTGALSTCFGAVIAGILSK